MSEYIISDELDVLRSWMPKLTEIVRCRDCVKWSFFDVEDGVRFGECAEFTAKVDKGFGHATREYGFCAWGEKASNFMTCKCGEDIETKGRESVTCPSCGRVVTE